MEGVPDAVGENGPITISAVQSRGIYLTTANRNYFSVKGRKANPIIGLSELDD
jgi:hypothetical protein